MNEKDNRKVPRRIAQTILNSLKGGVVPRIGLPYITVGRKNEIEALLHDVDIISEGGASFRFIVGRYGSGKSFLIQTIRNYVMDRGFIVADADLSPERRLQGTRGQGLATYRELIGNLSTKTRPEGGALTLVLDRWISSVQTGAVQETGLEPGDPALTRAVDRKIYEVTSAVSELVHGFEFARLLSLYYHAYVDGDDEMKMKVVRWFRGEYALKREAKEELGVNIIITDDDWYDYLKIFAVFFRLAGYAGCLLYTSMPDACWSIVFFYDEPQNAVVRTTKAEDMTHVGREAAEIMGRSVVSSDGDFAYKAEDLLERARNQQELGASTNNLLIWVASISLLVGGIGVMNIMLVSVTERTSEIGLKKAVGARKRKILTQFLTESAVLTSCGGVLGVIVGIILAQVIARMSGTPVAISIPAIIGSVAFSMLIGIVFGLLPSIKAANLNPIDALRRE